MILQSLFYLLAIILMLLFITVLIMGIYYIWKLERMVREAKEQSVEKVKSLIMRKESQIAGMVGLTVASFIINSIVGIFRRKNQDV